MKTDIPTDGSDASATTPSEAVSAPASDISVSGSSASKKRSQEEQALIDRITSDYDIDPTCLVHAAKLKSALEQTNIWVHLDANSPTARPVLHKLIPSLDAMALDAILDRDARPRAVLEDDWSYLILRAVNFNEGEESHDMIAIRMARDERFLVTLTYRDSRTIGRVAQTKSSRFAVMAQGDLMVKIVNLITDFKEPVIDRLQDRMDGIEAKVLDTPKVELRREIVAIRKEAILLRRYIAPQREAIALFRKDSEEFVTDKNRRLLADNWDTITRYLEDLDATRERASVIKDELANMLSDRLNRNLYVISVITAIFLPLGFLTGLFGINIGGMPGTEDGDAFTTFVWVLLGLVGIQVVLFKWFKWF